MSETYNKFISAEGALKLDKCIIIGDTLGALEIPDNLFKSIMEAGTKKLLRIGNSLYLSIPAGLFRIFWRKEDAINMYLLNDFTIIIINNEAKKRMEEANKVNINLGDTLVE